MLWEDWDLAAQPKNAAAAIATADNLRGERIAGTAGFFK